MSEEIPELDVAIPFISRHQSLREIMMDHKLASLGDPYVNFIFSLSRSIKVGKPAGVKVSGDILARALRKAGLRKFLPSRTDRHKQADGAEALIVYSWLTLSITFKEMIETLDNEDPVDAFTSLLRKITERIIYSSQNLATQ